MAIEDYLFEDGKQFEVVCNDNTSIDSEISKGVVYKVIGAIQGFFIMKNDKERVSKYHRDRFIMKGEEE